VAISGALALQERCNVVIVNIPYALNVDDVNTGRVF
jgi:hypothetical protein